MEYRLDRDAQQYLSELSSRPAMPEWTIQRERPLTLEMWIRVMADEEDIQYHVGNSGLVVTTTATEPAALHFAPNGMLSIPSGHEQLGTLHTTVFAAAIFEMCLHYKQLQTNNPNLPDEIFGETNPALSGIRQRLLNEIDPSSYVVTAADSTKYTYQLNIGLLAKRIASGATGTLQIIHTRIQRRIRSQTQPVMVNPLLGLDQDRTNKKIVWYTS